MAKAKPIYVCRQCGAQQQKWAGQCVDCGEWNTLEQSTVMSHVRTSNHQGYAGSDANRVVRLNEVETTQIPRYRSGLKEFDRVVGGGFVAGAAVLIGGSPGIGKSTILLQLLASLSSQKNTFYVTGEESLQQVGLRAERLGLRQSPIQMMAETQLESILQQAEALKPAVMVIDSIQTMFSEGITSAPGSVSQVRECTAALVRFAKQTHTTLFLVGHVTKEGALAGPRVLEHMVDTVLYFEGESDSRYRLVRALKNRYGAANELGVFAMTEHGLKEVSNPSAIFLSRHETEVSGSAIMVTREGSQPMLIEVQALVSDAGVGHARRLAVGLEHNRLAMLLAVLSRHGGTLLMDQDVFVNVVGGVRIHETAADLAIMLAVLSSYRDRPLPEKRIIFGEVGLSGEIRPVPNGQERLREALKHGFNTAVIPKANMPPQKIDGMSLYPVGHLREAIELV